MESLRTASFAAMLGLSLLATVAWTGFIGYALFSLVAFFI
jgi:hypothetical protein